MYACQKDNEHQENWTKWQLGLDISRSEPLFNECGLTGDAFVHICQ